MSNPKETARTRKFRRSMARLQHAMHAREHTMETLKYLDAIIRAEVDDMGDGEEAAISTPEPAASSTKNPSTYPTRMVTAPTAKDYEERILTRWRDVKGKSVQDQDNVRTLVDGYVQAGFITADHANRIRAKLK